MVYLGFKIVCGSLWCLVPPSLQYKKHIPVHRKLICCFKKISFKLNIQNGHYHVHSCEVFLFKYLSYFVIDFDQIFTKMLCF